MAKISIEYGKPRVDKSMIVSLRLVAGATQKRIATGIELDKSDYRVYPDGRIKITNDTKYFNLQDIYNEYSKLLSSILVKYAGVRLTAQQIMAQIDKERGNGGLKVNFFDYADRWLSISCIKGEKNYRTMLNSLQRYNNGSRTLYFSDITFSFLQGYGLSLKGKPRAQSLYLGAIRHIYKQACLEYNDDNETRLSANLFDRFKVPKQIHKGQRALTLDELKTFMAYKPNGVRDELAKDCAILSLFTMGTNSADLYNAKIYSKGILKYERTKTRDRRSDKAYIEIVVHNSIKSLFDKYKDKTKKHVFSFHIRYSTCTEFNKAINIGLKIIGKKMGIESLTFYQFRHTWASIARNELGASAYDVDEALNHKSRDNSLLDIYVKKDFRNINTLNNKVIGYILKLKGSD